MPPGDDGVGCALHIPPMKFSRKGVAHCLTLWHNKYMSMVRIAVRVPQSLADELRVEGEAHGCDLSWAVRRRLNADKAGDGGRGQIDGAVRAGLAGGGQGKRSEGDRKARKGGAGNLTVRGPDTRSEE